MRYGLSHLTRYAYAAPVDLGYHVLRMTPRATPFQRVARSALAITPGPAHAADFADHFGNAARHVAIEIPHEELTARLEAEVEVTARPLAALPPGPGWEAVRDAMRNDGFPRHPDVAEFCFPSPLAGADSAAGSYAALSFAPGRPLLDACRELTRRIHDDFTYVQGVTEISTPTAQVVADRRGVCQDFSHVMLAGLRHLGLPARYVSGYLRTYAPSDPGLLRGADASHAWVGVWCGDELGWIDFDPTNDRLVADEHITLAWGRDYDDVSPLRGVILGGGAHVIEVEVTVTPLG